MYGDKLEAAGIRGALKWFESFLNGRTEEVKILNKLSNPKVILKGVPQGSVLLVTLFLVFINDLLKSSSWETGTGRGSRGNHSNA